MKIPSPRSATSFPAALAAIALALAACTAGAAETTRVELPTPAASPHTFWIGPQAEVEKKNPAALKGTPDFSEGTQALEVTFDGDGPYAFGCFIPGHSEAGMKGTIALTT